MFTLITSSKFQRLDGGVMFASHAKCFFWLNVRQTSEKYRQIFNIKTENRPNI